MAGVPADPTDFDPFAPGRVFCVGAAGSGVRAMAELLHGFDWNVTGTDRAKPDVLARLAAKGVAVTHDPAGRTWDERPDFLLFSPAVPATDPARVRAATEGVPQRTHVDVLAALTRRRETVAVAGTHGKSSTAAALVHLLRAGGKKVAGFVGAEPVDPAYSFAHPDPELLVVEACEWNRHFLRLAPTHAVVTGVEFDHPDTYRDREDLNRAFAEFHRLPPRYGAIVRRRGEQCSMDAFANIVQVDWWTSNEELAGAAAIERGCDPEVVAAAIPSIPALRRRFEVFGERAGRTLISDSAHHPAGLEWLLPRARAASANDRAAVVFQPHQALRTRKLFVRFAAALAEFDAAAVLPVFAAREAASAKKCAKLSRDLAMHAGASFLPDLDALPAWADDSTEPGDALVLAGAGDIDAARHLFFSPAPG